MNKKSPFITAAPVLTPLLLWAALFLGRPLWYRPWCAVEPTPCVPDAVNSFDRVVFQFGSVFADFLSNLFQNGVGVVTVILPLCLFTFRRAGLEIVLALKATLWNAVVLETCRAIVQRPRPLVFHAPLTDGSKISQYTAFYSGHTSFVALASLAMTFMLMRRYPKQRWIVFNFGILYICLSAVTGSLRVFGGRHYPTDVIAGFIAGTLITLILNIRAMRSSYFGSV